jgi:hypothetical protein
MQSLKRKVDWEDDDLYDWSLTGEENRELANAVDSVTPQKQPGSDATVTPKRRRLPWMADEPSLEQALGTTKTPDPARSLFVPASTSSSKTLDLDTTPTPGKFRDVDAMKGAGFDDLEEDLISVLRSHDVPGNPNLQQALHQCVSKYQLRAQGVIKG